jgi:hypothetical protein
MRRLAAAVGLLLIITGVAAAEDLPSVIELVGAASHPPDPPFAPPE